MEALEALIDGQRETAELIDKLLVNYKKEDPDNRKKLSIYYSFGTEESLALLWKCQATSPAARFNT